MRHNKFQVYIGHIVHVCPEILGILCKNVYILVFLYVQIRECVDHGVITERTANKEQYEIMMSYLFPFRP